ncbi:MAG: insulinase family protein [Clostridia bacterium]|nr:insulinase family protein [Clostridia bacterium]MBQ1994934.1 insulinase family protein [Clostridia bacterium]MBQ5906278.1 insulinase family protein [Clostridia bacterium]
MELITLSNSLRIFLNHTDTLRSATVGVWIASGSRFEKEKNSGISHFIEHIVFKGSEKRSGFEIAEGMDEIGAYVNAYTTKEYTFFYTKALDYQILKAADILFDMLRNPRLLKEDIETEKGVITEEISMCEDDPADVCSELNERSIFKGTALEGDILGTRESVNSFDESNFKEHIKSFYVPERIVIGINGNFNKEEMLKKIEEYFGSLEDTGNPLKGEEIPFRKTMALKKMDTEQTHITLAFDGIPIQHEDLYPLQVCMFILGTGTSSMLNQRIREQLGLVYSIDSWLTRYLGGGYISVSMSLGSKSEEKALKETLGIIRSFSSVVTERQVEIAKEKLISSLIMSREQPQSKLSAMGYSLLFTGEFADDDEIIRRIKAVSLEKVKAVAEKYINTDEMSFTAVGRVKTEDEYRKILAE